QNEVLKRLAGTNIGLLAILLSLKEQPAWCDGRDSEGRSVVLIGRHQLGNSEAAQSLIKTVLEMLSNGNVPTGVHVIAFAPKASEAIETVVSESAASEVLLDGPRGSGKTQSVPACLAILAELHMRSGFKPPLRVLWLHDTIRGASDKTARSLEQEL